MYAEEGRGGVGMTQDFASSSFCHKILELGVGQQNWSQNKLGKPSILRLLVFLPKTTHPVVASRKQRQWKVTGKEIILPFCCL